MKKKYLKVFFAIIIFATVLVSCKDKIPEDTVIIARVGDQYLTDRQLAADTPDYLSEDTRREFHKTYVQKWLNRQILMNYFAKNKMALDDNDLRMLEEYKFELLYNHFLQTIAPDIPKATELEINNYYEEHKDEYTRDEDDVHLVILFLEKSNIGIEDDIKHSTRLDEVIKKNFLNLKVPNQREKNGDLGYVPVSSLNKKIRYAVKKYKTGKISRPIRTDKGIYYIQVLDYQPKGSIRELALVKNEIIHHLNKNNTEKFIRNLIQQESQQLVIDKFFNEIN